MNIEIKSFGPIEHLKFDLEKDLHMIYGKNAIGKSYAIYCLYCLLKHIKGKDVDNIYRYASIRRNEKGFKKFFDNIFGLESSKEKEKKNKSGNICSAFKNFFKANFQTAVLNDFQNSLSNTFSSLDSLGNKYNNQKFEIIINLKKTSKCKLIKIFQGKNGNLDVDIELNFNKLEFVEKETKRTKYSVFQDDKYLFGKSTEQERDSETVWIFPYIFGRNLF